MQTKNGDDYDGAGVKNNASSVASVNSTEETQDSRGNSKRSRHMLRAMNLQIKKGWYDMESWGIFASRWRRREVAGVIQSEKLLDQRKY